MAISVMKVDSEKCDVAKKIQPVLCFLSWEQWTKVFGMYEEYVVRKISKVYKSVGQ